MLMYQKYITGGLVGLVVTLLAVGEKGSGFNSSVARAHLRFNSRACKLADKQCWLWYETVIAYAVWLTSVVWYLGCTLEAR